MEDFPREHAATWNKQNLYVHVTFSQLWYLCFLCSQKDLKGDKRIKQKGQHDMWHWARCILLPLSAVFIAAGQTRTQSTPSTSLITGPSIEETPLKHLRGANRTTGFIVGTRLGFKSLFLAHNQLSLQNIWSNRKITSMMRLYLNASWATAACHCSIRWGIALAHLPHVLPTVTSVLW